MDDTGAAVNELQWVIGQELIIMIGNAFGVQKERHDTGHAVRVARLIELHQDFFGHRPCLGRAVTDEGCIHRVLHTIYDGG